MGAALISGHVVRLACISFVAQMYLFILLVSSSLYGLQLDGSDDLALALLSRASLR